MENKKQDEDNRTIEEIKQHHRVNDILLGPFERPAIDWLVKRLPRWVTPDMLTAFGFLSAVLIGTSYYLTNFNKNFLWLASLGFILNWFGDSLDGNLARHLNIERPKYGFFIDHTVDTISEVCIFIGIGLSPYVHLELALLALTGYLCMANLVYITTSVIGEFKISYSRLGPTEARMIAVIANAIIYFIGNPVIHLPWFSASLYNIIIIAVIVLLFFFFFQTTITQAVKLDRQDRQKRMKKSEKIIRK